MYTTNQLTIIREHTSVPTQSMQYHLEKVLHTNLQLCRLHQFSQSEEVLRIHKKSSRRGYGRVSCLPMARRW